MPNHFISYPSTFIDEQFEHFFSKYIGRSSFLPYIYNQHQLTLLKDEFYGQLTPRQSQATARAATADLDNDQTDDNDTAVATTHPTIFVNKSASSSPKDNKFFIHYNHERRFRPFKRNLHRIHNRLIPRNLGLDLRLIVGNRNRPYAANELIHKKPQRWLLTNRAKQIKRKYQRFLGKFKTIYSTSDHILNFNCRSTSKFPTNHCF